MNHHKSIQHISQISSQQMANLQQKIMKIMEQQRKMKQFVKLQKVYSSKMEQNEFLAASEPLNSLGLQDKQLPQQSLEVSLGQPLKDPYISDSLEQGEPSVFAVHSSKDPQQTDTDFSRVFKRIDMNAPKTALIHFQVAIKGKTTTVDVPLSTTNLSNFDSFNQNANCLEFRELISTIQTETGKMINEKGVLRITEQIKEAVGTLKNIQKCNKFDSALNHFHHSRKQPQVSLNVLNALNAKENVSKVRVPLKELKIVKKNNIKAALTMLYSEQKHIESYCILHKLTKSDRQRIQRAVLSGSSVVHLQ